MTRKFPQLKLTRSRHFLFLLILSVLASLAFSARASDEDDAKAAAVSFNASFDQNHMNQLWNSFAGQFLRSKVTQDAFVSQMAFTYLQLGGGAQDRMLIQEQSGLEPASGRLIYAMRYKARFPAATVYEDLSLIKEAQANWKLYGIFFAPVPTE